MTPGARVAAAAEILDRILNGQRAEAALTGWARANRYAGSKDRAAVRDLVFDAVRCKRSYAHLGGAATGRGLMLGALRSAGRDPAELMTGEGYAMAPPAADEQGASLNEAPRAVQGDMPDWIVPMLDVDLGGEADDVMAALRQRAPVFVRVNLAKADRDTAQHMLREDGITTIPLDRVKTALEVTENERRLRNSRAYLEGVVELQDAASQAAMLALPLKDGDRVLDYCAGGGGKSLAMAALADVHVTAHDAHPQRMVDLCARAARAGISVEMLETAALGTADLFDLVLVDAPCSGSGTWRRDPDTKWRLDRAALKERTALQAEILDQAKQSVAPGGRLAYATCSVLSCENDTQVDQFKAAHPGWHEEVREHWLPGPSGDGFFIAVLRRD